MVPAYCYVAIRAEDKTKERRPKQPISLEICIFYPAVLLSCDYHVPPGCRARGELGGEARDSGSEHQQREDDGEPRSRYRRHTNVSHIRHFTTSSSCSCLFWINRDRMTGRVSDVSTAVDMSKPQYTDSADYPLPDVPYKQVLTDADKSLKQKEKGPWNQLSKEEKLALYRLKFLKTYPEMRHSTPEWKTALGAALFLMGFTGFIVWWQKVYGKSAFIL
ncbi:Cytochrome c oxidase subunit 4 isoform 2, mitochondrial [Larimichthys crocea]|uniref:Uncharacterized protein n=1 Tax=Larimichthys crocea TaxID=215358 RepID=A0ACD3RAZ9_LARCR|nr:Cytochrome c oxidase subunit 4 isoform 2, mitochondrial [Larimichthys crocea]